MPQIDFSHLSLGTFFLVYLAGVATSLTPCVYPILPVVVGFLGIQNGSIFERGLSSFFYVLGLSLVYALLGMVAVLTGTFFGEFTASWPVYLVFGILMIGLGGSMMDFYNLPLPSFMQPKAGSGKKSYLSSFLVGASSGLVASPCTAPVLAGLLLYVSNQKNYVSGAGLMIVFALGLNTTLLAIGFSANLLAHLPKSGLWMVKIKKILALLIIAGGLYFVFRAGQIY